MFHSLLARQMMLHLGCSMSIPPEMEGLIKAVDETYRQNDREREALEQTLDLSSQKLIRTNSEMRVVIHTLPDLMVRADGDGLILDYKIDAVGEYFLSKIAFGGCIYDIFPKSAANKFRRAIADLIENPASIHTIEYSLRKKSSVYFYEARLKPLLENQIIIIVRNITKQKRAEDALRESEERYRTLAEKSFAGVYVVQDGLFRFITNSAAAYAGYTSDELTGTTALSLLHPEDQELARRNSLDMLQGLRTAPNEFRIIGKDGTARWIMETVTPILYKGQKAILGNSMDITEKKEFEAQLLYLSTHDVLTGLYNRAYFEEELKRLENGRLFPVSVVVADVDDLKKVNDSMGHARGDDLIRRAADVLNVAFRTEDVVARIGGDEFGVLLPGADLSTAKSILGRVRLFLDKHNSEHEGEPLSISMGFKTGSKGHSLAMVMKEADRMMYSEKKSRKAMGET